MIIFFVLHHSIRDLHSDILWEVFTYQKNIQFSDEHSHSLQTSIRHILSNTSRKRSSDNDFKQKEPK